MLSQNFRTLSPPVQRMWPALTVNLTQSRVTWEESLNGDMLSTLVLPVGMSVLVSLHCCLVEEELARCGLHPFHRFAPKLCRSEGS